MEELLFIRQEVMPAMLRGVWVSIQLILPSAFFGLLLGVLSGVLRVYGNPVLKGLAGLYLPVLL
jgi:polar amino acid transport system permease protein